VRWLGQAANGKIEVAFRKVFNFSRGSRGTCFVRSFTKLFQISRKSSDYSIQPENPYRSILRREYPEPLIALLALILGIWLWDHYFGQNQGYAPGTEELALVKIDRDLRLSDAMAEDAAWLRWLAAVDEPAALRRDALVVFQKLAADESLSLRGLEAFAIIKAVEEGQPISQTVGGALQGQTISDFSDVSYQLANHRGSWWHARWVEEMEREGQAAADWKEAFGEDGQRLRSRAVVARSAVWLLGLVGLLLLPGVLFRLRKVAWAKSDGYGGAWPVSLGLLVFMLATLAWIGFSLTLELGIAALPSLPPLMGILLDSAARLLPALIALGLLFRKPSHAARVLGLDRAVQWREILGLFAGLVIVDQILRALFGTADASEPGGGLSLSDAGGWGLVFAVVSACLLAPLAEETLYRGVLFRSFWNRMGVLPAAVLSAGIFAMLHIYDGYGLASVGVFGFTCALLYASTGSLTTVIVLHVLYNSAIKIPEWIVYHAPLG
jgi:membrane protease YdiL (CAAX protease family)